MRSHSSFSRCCLLAIVALTLIGSQSSAAWSVGEPIVMYWEYWPVPVNPTTVEHALVGGYNVMHVRSIAELDYIHQFGLRGMLHVDNWNAFTAEKAAEYAAHPAMYAYYLDDEFGDADFPDLANTMAFLSEHDPEHVAYLSIGANHAWFEGYSAWVDTYMDALNPELLSYNHFQFMAYGDDAEWFSNLVTIRQKALDAGIPFLNTVQGSAWWYPGWQIPNEGQLRYLNYTTLAYGAQGISYWVYHTPYSNQAGGIGPEDDGSPTQIYTDLIPINPQFVEIATEVQSLQSVGAYHLGDQPLGTTRGLPFDSPFTISPTVANSTLTGSDPVEGLLLGIFGPDDQVANATHALIVNLDYSNSYTTTVTGPEDLLVFDATTGIWTPADSPSVALTLEPGGGILVALPIDGDLNGDFLVGGYDGTQILANWGMTGGRRTDGDLNGDGAVNGTDFTEVLTNWGMTKNSPPRPPLPLKGDVDGDGSVNGSDLSIVVSYWGQIGLGKAFGDLDGNGTVDGADYSEVLSYWGTSASEPPDALPEPATLGLLLIGGLALLRRRRKQPAQYDFLKEGQKQK